MSAPTPVLLSHYQKPEFDIQAVDLAFDLHDDRTIVTSKLKIKNLSTSDRLLLDGEKLTLNWIKIDGRALPKSDYEVTEKSLLVKNIPKEFTLETEVAIEPQNNTALEGLYFRKNLFCTQNEAEGFRRITFYLDRPDVMSVFKTTIRADKKKFPVLLSNGNKMSGRDIEDGRHEVVWQDPFKKPCYLFALVAGDLGRLEDTFTTMSGRKVSLEIYVKHGLESRCRHAMDSLKRAMKWDEDVFAREYDLDLFMIVAAEDFNGGAMENKGLNIFNSSLLLANAETATDNDYERIEGVIAHEYFHNWTGNRITLRDWFQLSLKEGLTVFRDQEFSSDMGSRGVRRIDDVIFLRMFQFPEDAGPMAHPIRPESYIEINNFYTPTVYEKGAEVIRMIRTMIGPELFRKSMDYYFERYDGRAITTEDFVAAMEKGSGRDLTLFKRWYGQAGTPQLSVSTEYSEKANTYTLHFRQSYKPTIGQSKKEPVVIPVKMALLDQKGIEMPLSGQGLRGSSHAVLEMTQAEQSFVFEKIPTEPVPSFLREFSAPVQLDWNGKDEELAFLASHDSDAFSRWEAFQQLCVRVILRLKKSLAKNETAEVPEVLLGVFKKILSDTKTDVNVLSRLLELPSESYLSQMESEIDIDGIHKARELLRLEVSKRCQSDLWNVVKRLTSTSKYVWNVPEAGRRAFRGHALAWLCMSQDSQAIELAFNEFKSADNMTDEFNRLSILANVECPQRSEALKLFYRKWQTDSLVMNKWLSVQAMSRLPDTLDRIRTILKDPIYDETNPNKVYSLVRCFGLQNAVQFHQPTGAGYAFLADQVLSLDGKNPQVASRVVSAFNLWKRYDVKRRSLMESQLKRIMTTKPLSNNVFEIVSRSLS